MRPFATEIVPQADTVGKPGILSEPAPPDTIPDFHMPVPECNLPKWDVTDEPEDGPS